MVAAGGTGAAAVVVVDGLVAAVVVDGAGVGTSAGVEVTGDVMVVFGADEPAPAHAAVVDSASTVITVSTASRRRPFAPRIRASTVTWLDR